MKSISRPSSRWPHLMLGLSGALCLVLAGCAKDTDSKEPKSETAQPPQKGTAADPLGQGAARLEMPGAKNAQPGADKSYSITLDSPENLAQGSEGVVKVNVVPGPGWKMNKDFPTRLQVTAPEGVTLVKDSQVIEDAESFEDKGAVFAVKFKADSPGTKSFKADFKFAVCTDATCDPKRQELAWVVNVQ